MNFSEARFWGYLIIALGIALAGRVFFGKSLLRAPGACSLYDRSSILLVSLWLLGCMSWLTLGIFLSVCILTYIGMWCFVRAGTRGKWMLMVVLIPLQLLPLGYFKYSDFLVNGILGQNIPVLERLIIPVGLSFYTFQMIGFLIDTASRGTPLPRFLDFMNFAGFFPQIVAGPIERRENLLPQMQSFQYQWNAANINQGATWIALGLFFKMCLADNLALFFGASDPRNPFLVWLDNLLFGLRIYYDFAGYSFTALGLAMCLGVSLTINFASPYLATSPQEFWRRWHITLSTWFRDYLYIPLGGSRTRLWPLALLFVFVVSGVWHGSGWGFVLWGAVWGLFLVVFRFANPLFRPAALGCALTLLAAMFAWLFFYETETAALTVKLTAIFTPAAYSLDNLKASIASIGGTQAYVLVCFLTLSFFSFALEFASLACGGAAYCLLRRPWVSAALVVLTVLLAPSEKNDFIYFAF